MTLACVRLPRVPVACHPQDPYVVFRLEDQSGHTMSRGRTGAVKRGGKDPVWTSADTPSVQMEYSTTPARPLTLHVRTLGSTHGLAMCSARPAPNTPHNMCPCSTSHILILSPTSTPRSTPALPHPHTPAHLHGPDAPICPKCAYRGEEAPLDLLTPPPLMPCHRWRCATRQTRVIVPYPGS